MAGHPSEFTTHKKATVVIGFYLLASWALKCDSHGEEENVVVKEKIDILENSALIHRVKM